MSSILLTYSKLIKTNVASQAINLADSGIMGHRVQCPMSIDDLNRFFIWQRTSNESAPIGHFTPHEDISGASFSYILANTLSKYYTDIDGVTGGLNFGSSVLDSNPDPTIRENGKITANDIIMAYVIYKIYGSSANPTMNVVFNLQDAYNMLPNSVLVKSIEESLKAEEALSRDGAVNDMFQDLLSEDPTRFFDAAGKQIPGLFEVNSTDSFTGSWNFVENDRIELNVQFTFTNPVTVNSTAGDSENIESKVVIPAGVSFKIRLQLLATNTPTAAAAIQKAYVAASAEELARQVEVNKEAVQNAADALAVATQATSAAQAQTAAEKAKYNAAVTRNSQQQKRVLSAQAAVQAAQDALAAAQLSGNQANIQQQNAAALAAEALLENQQAIADLAAADLQNAATALAKATATLNAAQSAAAAAAAAQAAANTAVANSSLALEIARATSLESTIAAATAASDPLTQALELEKNTVLDPQNLAIILAKANTATNRRKLALNTAVHTFAHQTSQLNNYNSILYTMNSALATGSNDSQLQLYKAMVVGASNILNTVTKTSQTAASTLAASYTAELTAIQHANLASSNAASLSATVAVANTNSANRSLVTATTAYVYASTMNANAAAAAAEAQSILNNRVSNGAVMTEVQTRTQALLDANKTYAAAASTMNGALAKMTNATVAYQKASTIAVHAKVHISSVATSNLFYLSQYKTSVSTSSAYQANILSNAKLNQIAIEVNSSLIRLNAANAKVATARANVSLAQLAIDTALAGGAILSELTVLKGAYSKANDSLTQALLIQVKAQAEYNAHTENAANGQVQLLQSDAMAFFNASITQQQVATDTIGHYSTLLVYATQHPTAFPPIDGLSSTEVYSTQLAVWQTYLANFQTLSQTLLTQYNTNLMRASTLIAANPSISTSLGSLSNYYVANSNSSHLIFQANSISSLLVSLSNIGLAPVDLEADLATYSSQSNAALDTTATAYNTYLADSLAAQSISLVSSVGQNILNAAANFQLAQISSATMNTKMNFYTSTLASIGMIQLEYDQVSSDVSIAGQLLSNASVTNTPPSQLTLLQQKYANVVATQASLANRLSGLSATVSTMNSILFSPTATKYETPSVSGIQLWLDASDPRANGSAPVNGTAITTWYDKSANGYHAGSIGSPILTNNGVQFDGIGSAFTTTYPANNAEETAFMIVSIDDINVQNDLLSGELGSREYLIYGGAPTLTTIGGGLFLESGGILTSRKRTLIQFNFSSSNINFYTNGTLISSHPGSYTPPTSGNTLIGSYNVNGAQGNFFKGVISEIITFNRTLLESERNTVEGYLAWKWGLEAELPTTHPYFLSYPTVPSTPAFTKVGPTAGIWTTIAMSSDGKKIIGAGVDLIYTSSDSGKTWSSSVSGAGINWQSVSCSADASVAYGITYAGIIYKSTDSGVTWTALAVQPLGNAALKICCSSNGSILLIAGVQYAYLSTDGGSTWVTTQNASVQGTDVAMSADGSVLYYTDYQIGVYVSIDGGVTWTQTSIPPLPSGSYSIACSADGSTAIIGVTSHGVYITRNKGATWAVVGALPTSFWLTGLAVSGDGKTIAISAYYSTGLYLSKDSGTTWTQFMTPAGSTITGIAMNTSGTILAVVDRDTGFYISNSLTVPTSSSPYIPATMLRQAELAVAKKNELVHQANTTFNKFSELNDKLQAATQSTNTVLDGISLALANGAKISEIRPLEEKLASLQKYISLTQFDAQNMYNTFITLSTLVTPDASFISTVNTNASTLYTATLNSRLNESARQVEAKQVEATAATTSLQKSEASLVLVSTQMATAVQQGLGFAQLAPLRSSLEAAYLDVSHKTTFLNYTSTSLAQAQSNYQALFTTPDIYSVFTNNSTNIATQFSTLTQSQIYQSTAINSAMNNVLTANLTNAFMGFMNYSTQTATDSANYSTLRIEYDTQISQGSNVNDLSNLLDKINTASLQYSLNTQYTEQYSAAYTSSLMLAREDPAAKAILIRVAANETAVIEGAKTNTLYNTLMTAQEKLFLQNSAFINAQAEYNVANSDIQIATTNGCSPDVLASKLSTLGGRGKELSAEQIKLTLATNAVQQANSYVNMNSNSMTILNSATTQYTLQSAAAQANTLYAQYAAAAANEAKTYAAVQLANSVLDSAKSVFNSSIQAGLDISSIQAYRNAVTEAGEALSKAEFNQTNANNALNVAIQNANINQVAQSLIVTARLENENTKAGATVNSAQANLDTLSTNVAAAYTILSLANTTYSNANATLETSTTNGLTSQEITDIQAAATDAANKQAAAQLTFSAVMKKFNAEAALVSSLTQKFSTTTATLTLNTLNTNLLYNGFIYNQTTGKYVLKPSVLPSNIRNGVPFNLYSFSVTPMNLGVYNPLTPYVLGNLVYYPDFDGAQYMCALSPNV